MNDRNQMTEGGGRHPNGLLVNFLTREEQGAAPILVLYTSCKSKTYRERRTKRPVVYSNNTTAYKRKIKSVARIELLYRTVTSNGLYNTFREPGVA